ncbi:hypothetical protein [Pseudomonas saudiphocaensis]|uniref:Uncharacterized protein n=1 Tax=Pseudomonas saudiphocaensis TaxID=1499686 RepID=A0A078LNK4_9PSED|nr:hypothetical protein [Pseudomonas saudiphocaensis]CDZ94078.1 hypothetical protein BN1079_01389 [Pseudomonas saudiphocaensis]
MPALSRDELLSHPDALDCTIYRAHPTDPEGEEQDMGDARVVITGPFEAPVEWDAKERADYFDGMPEEDFFTAVFASEAATDSREHFTVEADDYAAVTQADGSIAMYYVCERTEDGNYVLLREEDDGDE